jgi:hypothetical protein
VMLADAQLAIARSYGLARGAYLPYVELSPSRAAGGACKEKVAWHLNALNAQRHVAESGQLALGTSGSLLGSCGGFLFLVAGAILKPTLWEEGIQCVTIPWHTFPTAWP